MQRADLLLLELIKLVPSRTAAQRLIIAGSVEAQIDGQWQTLHKPGVRLPTDTPMRLRDHSELRYVSRGGLKLAAALAHCGLSVRDHTVLDVGQSTGGFTDALLQAGSKRVIGIDVGHGQLRQALRNDPRVIGLEGINARELPAAFDHQYLPEGGFDRIVMDVSFISQTRMLAPVLNLAAPDARLLALVKPQFEVGKAHIGKGGIVRDREQHARVRRELIAHYEALDLRVEDYFDSAIQGADGNREYFILARLMTLSL